MCFLRTSQEVYFLSTDSLVRTYVELQQRKPWGTFVAVKHRDTRAIRVTSTGWLFDNSPHPEIFKSCYSEVGGRGGYLALCKLWSME